MYTGIIQQLGEIMDVIPLAEGLRIRITSDFESILPGESISVNGICLTAIAPKEGEFSAELSPETLALTTAKIFKPGQKVNLERSLQASDRLGGHFVMGHVDGIAEVISKEIHTDFTHFNIQVKNPALLPYFVKKGSVSVDGISLTINDIHNDQFSLMIIPHTFSVTNVQYWAIHDKVNIEVDTFARLTIDTLKRYIPQLQLIGEPV